MYYRLTTDVNSNITETEKEHTQADDPPPKDETEFKLNDLLKVKIKPRQVYIPNDILNKTMSRRMMGGRR